jgi:cell division protease FtsH
MTGTVITVMTLLTMFTILAILVRQQRQLNDFAIRSHGGAAPPPPPRLSPTEPERPTTSRTEEERTTRKRTPLWDRVKFLILLSLVWFVLVWAAVAENPLLSFADSVRIQSRAAAWVFVLLGVELLRQLHFLVSERSARYHRFWTERVFGATDRWMRRRFGDWTRFRLSRALKWLFWVAVLSVVLSMIYDTTPVLGLFRAPAAALAAAPMVFQLAFAAFFVIFQFAAIFWFLSKGGVDVYYPDDVKTRFRDVWGQDHVLDRVKENMLFLDAPEKIEAKGGYVPGGILLWGPPGTGKTLIAEAVAGETGKPYVFVDPGAFQNMFFGVGILKVKSLFRKLRRLALRYGGVIVFFDEADSLGSRGGGTGLPGGQAGMLPAPYDACHGFSYLSPQTQATVFASAAAPSLLDGDAPRRRGFMMGGMGGGGGMGTLQALLTELSGLKKPRGFVNRIVRRTLGMRPKPPPKYRILVMMATNMPGSLDQALLRPGRIDRIYHVGYPSKDGRRRTYEGYFAKVANDVAPEQIERLATITPYATGASIKDLVNESLIVALRDGRDLIHWEDVLKAKLLKSVGPDEGVEYIERERHAVAVHESCHAVTSYMMQRGHMIDTATIQKGQGHLGFILPLPIEERFMEWRTTYEADVMVSLASLVGERMFFGGDNSSGVTGDLDSATRTVMAMHGVYGMGSTYRSYLADRSVEMDGSRRIRYSKEVGERAEELLAELADRTEVLLTKHRRDVLALAHALEEHRTFSGEDVIAIMERKAGPIVDGRIYDDQGFVDALEAYHADVLRVHQGNAHTMKLPTMRVIDGEGAARDAASAATPRDEPPFSGDD